MSWQQLSFAYAAGLVAVINPCGFAMLPAYLSYFVGADTRAGSSSDSASLARALRTGLIVTSGFMVVFGIVGISVSAGLSIVRDAVPWMTMVIGAALVALGIAFIAGFRVTVLLPKFERGTGGTDARSLFLFGISYAVASISCALPTFIVVVSTSASSVGEGVVAFAVYSVAMGTVLTSLAVSLAFARTTLLAKLRSAMRHADRIAGVLMVLAGAYLIAYWIAEEFDVAAIGLVTGVENLSSNLTNAIATVGGFRLGLIMSMVVAVAMMRIIWVRSTQLPLEASPTQPEMPAN